MLLICLSVKQSYEEALSIQISVNHKFQFFSAKLVHAETGIIVLKTETSSSLPKTLTHRNGIDS